MNALQDQLELNVEKLSSKLTLSKKINIIKDCKDLFKQADTSAKKAQKLVEDYKPNPKEIINISDTISYIEEQMEILKSSDLDTSIDMFPTLMDNINAIELFINNTHGVDELIAD